MVTIECVMGKHAHLRHLTELLNLETGLQDLVINGCWQFKLFYWLTYLYLVENLQASSPGGSGKIYEEPGTQ